MTGIEKWKQLILPLFTHKLSCLHFKLLTDNENMPLHWDNALYKCEVKRLGISFYFPNCFPLSIIQCLNTSTWTLNVAVSSIPQSFVFASTSTNYVHQHLVPLHPVVAYFTSAKKRDWTIISIPKSCIELFNSMTSNKPAKHMYTNMFLCMYKTIHLVTHSVNRTLHSRSQSSPHSREV